MEKRAWPERLWLLIPAGPHPRLTPGGDGTTLQQTLYTHAAKGDPSACNHLHGPSPVLCGCPESRPRSATSKENQVQSLTPLPWFDQHYCVLLSPLPLCLGVVLGAVQMLLMPAQCSQCLRNDSSGFLLLLVLVFPSTRTSFSEWTQSWMVCHSQLVVPRAAAAMQGSRKSHGQRAQVSSRSGRMQNLLGSCENLGRHPSKRCWLS